MCMLYRTFPQEHASWASYQILERRSNLGGTWDFFKYPGIRSDSDMFTFGFSWKIWKSAEPIATGEAIMAYLKEAAEEQGLMEKIRFNTDIASASWSSLDNKWHLVTKSGAKFSCDVLFGCTGYYSYEGQVRRGSLDQSSTHRSGPRNTTRRSWARRWP